MHPITARIAALHRCLKWRERAVAACSTLAIVLAAAWALGLIDYWFRLRDRGLRVMLTAALAAIAAWAIFRWWMVPRRRGNASLAVAQQIEARFPGLRDRLSSSLEFLEQSEDDETAGSPTLRRAVVNQTELELAESPIETIIDRRPLRSAAIWAVVVGAIVVGCAICDPVVVRMAAMRLVSPWSGSDWPRANHLAFRDPPPQLAVGQTFDAELFDRNGSLPDDVRIEYRFERGGRRELQSDSMSRAGDVMVARRENVREPFAFRAEGGDDDTMRWIAVEVVEPPQLDSLAITVHPPAYTGLSGASAQPHLEVLAGTSIELVGRAKEPLGAARIILGKTAINAAVQGDAFAIVPGQWIAAESGNYRLKLANREGVSGTAGEWTLRVEPDTPPTVTWRQPHDDLFVLPTATVPIAAVAKDNLAIARVDLSYTRSDDPDADAATIELYRGPERPIAPDIESGDSRAVDYTWTLAPLGLSAGVTLTITLVADDYRPGTGKTLSPRRITIITPEELDARLADQQSQIARRIEEALTLQRIARSDTVNVEIQLRDAGELTSKDKIVLQATELNQRRVGRLLTDPADSVAALANGVAAELKMNGVDDAEFARQLQDLNERLAQLSAGPQAAADQALTAARKVAEADVSDSGALAHSLEIAGVGQETSLLALEQMLSAMAGSADIGRLVRDLARLREDQLAHSKNTRDEIGLDTLPLELHELSRQQQARLHQAAAAEATLARRYERVDQDMGLLAGGQNAQDVDASTRLADAVALARQLAIAGKMRQSTLDLENNRVGQALAREATVASAIDQVLDVLRNRQESQPEELIRKLRATERRLAALREEVADLRAQAAAAEGQSVGAELGDQQQLRRQIAQLGRELERLQASAAGRSTQQASEQLAESANGGRPASSEQIDRAEQDLAEAAQQLAARRQQAEEDWARAFLERFKVELAAMVDAQRGVIQSTADLDARRGKEDHLTDAERQTLSQLAGAERKLADDSHVQSELLAGLRVFGVALADAEGQLKSAAAQLDDHASGAATLQAERRALERFEQIARALEQAAAAANNAPPGGQGSGGDGNNQRPLFDLFEVKLLRTLQADLNDRTQAFQERHEGEKPAARQHEAEDLAAEQGRLAELVEELLSRDNDSEGDDEGNEDE